MAFTDLDHSGNCLAHVVNVLAVERSHAHTASVSAVHAKLGTQTDHLFLGQAGV